MKKVRLVLLFLLCVCSAGVGRSGTFVALLWLMQLCKRGIFPEVRKAVQDLRKHRVSMVHNLVGLLNLGETNMHAHLRGLTRKRLFFLFYKTLY